MSTAKKEVIVTAAIILGIICGIWFNSSHQVSYQIKGTCVERFTVGDKNGNACYKVIIRYEDNTVETLDLTADTYITYQVGTTYIYDRSKFQLSK